MILYTIKFIEEYWNLILEENQAVDSSIVIRVYGSQQVSTVVTLKKEHGWGELSLFQLEYIFKQYSKHKVGNDRGGC